MLKRNLALLSAAVLLVAVVGCRIEHLSLGIHDDGPHHTTYVHAAPVHVCGYDCNLHYWNGGTTVIITGGHHHGHGCGHHWNGSHWLLGGPVTLRVDLRDGGHHRGHGKTVVIQRDNGHHRGHGKTVVIKRGNGHGRGHGKTVVIERKNRHGGGHGKTVVITHRHSPSCGHVYSRHGTKWISIEVGHRHHVGCGHFLIEGRWSIKF